MRNLKLLHSNCVATIPQLEGAQCIDVDYDTGHIYVATAAEILVLDAKAHEVGSGIMFIDISATLSRR